MLRYLFPLFFFIAPLQAYAYDVDSKGLCKDSKGVADACFSVYGRLFYYVDPPKLRIWVTGTRDTLTIPDPETEYEGAAKSLTQYLTWKNDGFGTYLVCPYTKREPGKMQSVCIESATSVTFKKH